MNSLYQVGHRLFVLSLISLVCSFLTKWFRRSRVFGTDEHKDGKICGQIGQEQDGSGNFGTIDPQNFEDRTNNLGFNFIQNLLVVKLMIHVEFC